MRRAGLLIALVVVALALAWSGFWFYTARDIEARVAAWAELQRAQGLSADYASLHVGGFPLAWRVHIALPHMAGVGPTGWEWRGGAAIATLRPWALHDIPMTFPGDHRLSGGAGGVAETVLLNAAEPNGRILLDDRGRLARLALDLGAVSALRSPAAAPAKIRRVQFSLEPHRLPTATHMTDVLDIALAAEDITLPPPGSPLGDKIAHARLGLSVKGALPPGRLAASVASWRDDGGSIEVPHLTLAWGRLDLEGSGTLALDGENRPLGAFSVRVRGYGETVDALSAAGLMRPRDASAVKIALNLFARPNADGVRELKVPITAQDGGLSVAGLPLVRLAPLRFE